MGTVKDKNPSTAAELRRHAEDRLQAKNVESQPPRTEAGMQRRDHELEVHQIELEMQNAELRGTREELELSRDTYAELYDYAPVGYFTFDAHGVIREVNLSGAQLLGVERQQLTNKPFAGFIADMDGRKIFSCPSVCLSLRSWWAARSFLRRSIKAEAPRQWLRPGGLAARRPLPLRPPPRR